MTSSWAWQKINTALRYIYLPHIIIIIIGIIYHLARLQLITLLSQLTAADSLTLKMHFILLVLLFNMRLEKFSHQFVSSSSSYKQHTNLDLHWFHKHIHTNHVCVCVCIWALQCAAILYVECAIAPETKWTENFVVPLLLLHGIVCILFKLSTHKHTQIYFMPGCCRGLLVQENLLCNNFSIPYPLIG